MACSRPGGAVEAANRHLQHGLEALDLKTIVAFSRSDNVASRRVLGKNRHVVCCPRGSRDLRGGKVRGTGNSDQAAQGHQAGSPAAALLDLPEQRDQISVFQVLRAQRGHGCGVVFGAGTELSLRLGYIVGGGF